jgi:hypothetical protein
MSLRTVEPLGFASHLISAPKQKSAFRRISFVMERVMGIEPTPAAWEAAVLPLNYTRIYKKTLVPEYLIGV